MPTSSIDRALALIAQRLPASEGEIARTLKVAGLAHGPVSLAQLERAARFAARPASFAVIRRPGLVIAVPSGKRVVAQLVHTLALRAMRRFGLCAVTHLCFEARLDDAPFVTCVVSAKVGFSWLDRARGWFWFPSPRVRLVQNLERIVAATGGMSLRALADMLFRGWPPALVPPLRALRTLCRSLPHLEVSGSTVAPTCASASTSLDQTAPRD